MPPEFFKSIPDILHCVHCGVIHLFYLCDSRAQFIARTIKPHQRPRYRGFGNVFERTEHHSSKWIPLEEARKQWVSDFVTTIFRGWIPTHNAYPFPTTVCSPGRLSNSLIRFTCFRVIIITISPGPDLPETRLLTALVMLFESTCDFPHRVSIFSRPKPVQPRALLEPTVPSIFLPTSFATSTGPEWRWLPPRNRIEAKDL